MHRAGIRTFELKLRANSLFRNILRVSGLNSKIWREIFCKLLIPKDRHMGGGVYLLVDDYYLIPQLSAEQIRHLPADRQHEVSRLNS
jgi:hypothetical protein